MNEKCPKCGGATMPEATPSLTARRCRNGECQHLQELVPYDPVARTWNGVPAEPMLRFIGPRTRKTFDDFDPAEPIAIKSIP